MNSVLKVVSIFALCGMFLSGCALPTLPEATKHNTKAFDVDTYEYLIGPNDVLNVVVWRHEEVTGNFNVKPDGKITMPLIGDISVSGKTTSEVSEILQKKLDTMFKSPSVSVLLNRFSGEFSEQVRVIGHAVKPMAFNYSKNMTLLDIMVQAGGLTKYADGNDAVLIRMVNGKRKEFGLNIDDLIKDGDLSENVDILPGDVIVIPEAWF